MQGSLAKFYFEGHNLYTLNRITIKKAIKKMCTEIGLPIQDGTISRIDIADNFFVTKPVIFYTNFFGSLGYFQKSTRNFGETIYMGNKMQEIVFYDKIKEMDHKKVKYPTKYKGKETSNSQILRYEFRVFKIKKCSIIQKILRQNGSRDFHVELLFDKKFYNSLVDIWLDLFEKIPKINTILSGVDKIKTGGNFFYGCM